MATTFDKTAIQKKFQEGFHPDGFIINKNGSPMDLYTRWEITPDGIWRNPKPTCFDSMPEKGWQPGTVQ